MFVDGIYGGEFVLLSLKSRGVVFAEPVYCILLQPGDFLDLETLLTIHSSFHSSSRSSSHFSSTPKQSPSNSETKHPVNPCHNTPPMGTGLDEQSVSCFFSRCFIWCIYRQYINRFFHRASDLV